MVAEIKEALTDLSDVTSVDVRITVLNIELFAKHKREILGLIENMSYFQCAHSSEHIDIFGHGGGKKLSSETELPLLGAIPIDLEISQGGDSGIPLMISSPDSTTGHLFLDIAEKINDSDLRPSG